MMLKFIFSNQSLNEVYINGMNILPGGGPGGSLILGKFAGGIPGGGPGGPGCRPLNIICGGPDGGGPEKNKFLHQLNFFFTNSLTSF